MCQGGDFNGEPKGTGGASIYGGHFADEARPPALLRPSGKQAFPAALAHALDQHVVFINLPGELDRQATRDAKRGGGFAVVAPVALVLNSNLGLLLWCVVSLALAATHVAALGQWASDCARIALALALAGSSSCF